MLLLCVLYSLLLSLLCIVELSCAKSSNDYRQVFFYDLVISLAFMELRRTEYPKSTVLVPKKLGLMNDLQVQSHLNHDDVPIILITFLDQPSTELLEILSDVISKIAVDLFVSSSLFLLGFVENRLRFILQFVSSDLADALHMPQVLFRLNGTSLVQLNEH